ncbi:hypothetical protein Trydic_g23743 [Trypoxylus dichotomus]
MMPIWSKSKSPSVPGAPQVTVVRTEIEWSGRIESVGIILDKRFTFSEYLKRTSTRAIGRIFQLYPPLSNPALRIKTVIMLYKLHIRPVLTYANPSSVTEAPIHIQSFNGAAGVKNPIRRRRPGGIPRLAK